MKNLAKKTVAIAAAGILIFFSGCSNLLGGGDSSQNNEKNYTVSGSINLGSALPSSVASALQSAESSARTATSSFSSASASAVWTVTAKQGEKSVTGSVYQVAGVYKYNLELPLSGEWLLHVKMTIGSSVILEGEASLFAVSGTSQVQDVLVSPVTSSGTGSVNLTITDGTASTLISRVSSKAVQNLHAIDSHGGNSVNTGIKEFTNKKAAIVMNNVPAGRYEATLNFEDSAGNILYSCKEIFTVFAGFTTDIWSGESAYIHNGVFSVTDALINGYGTETVNASKKMVQYEPYSEEIEGNSVRGFKYYLTENAGSSLSDSTIVTTVQNSDIPLNSYCFDAEGNIYFLSYGQSGSASLCIKSTKYEDIYIEEINSLSGITIDSATNVLYAYYAFQESYEIYKFSSLVSDGSASYENIPNISFSDINSLYFYHDNTRLVVNNGVIYGFANESKTFYKVDLSESSPVAKKIDFNFESFSSSASGSDMIYQDGAVYLLVRDVSSSSNFTSRGAIIRYDILFGAFSLITNWTDTKLPGKFYACGNNGFLYDAGSGNANRKPVTFEYSNKSVYAPNSSFENITLTLSNNALYGPAKFIAIKPKKLVIADDGLAFYTDENGAFKYKNVNRVVTVDLESFSLVSSETNAKFESDNTGFIKDSIANTPENFYSAIGKTAAALYEESGAEYGDYVYAGIPFAGE